MLSDLVVVVPPGGDDRPGIVHRRERCDVRSAVAKQGCGAVRITLRRGVDTLTRDVRLVDTARFERKKGTCEGGDGAR